MFFMFTFHILLGNVIIDPSFLTRDFDLCDTPYSYPICLVLGKVSRYCIAYYGQFPTWVNCSMPMKWCGEQETSAAR